MSETDSFIEEVSEEVRRDQLYRLFRKWGWLAGLIIVLIVGGAAFNEYRKATARQEAERVGDALLTALNVPADARLEALRDVRSDDPGTQSIIDLITATASADAGEAAAADAALASLAADGDAPALYRDIARLKRLTLPDSPMSREDRIATIETLSVAGSPFRTLATELMAMLHLEEGDNEAALAMLQDLAQDAEATPAQLQRVQQMIVILSGTEGEG